MRRIWRKSVTISDAKLALVKDIDPTADPIGNEISTQKVVVVPTADFGTLPATSQQRLGQMIIIP